MRHATLHFLLLLGLVRVSTATPKVESAFNELPAKPGYVRLYIFRVKQFAASAVKPMLKIDGVEVGKLPNGSSMALYIRPGVHEIETKIPLINYPIKGGIVKVKVPEIDEFYLRYRTDVQVLSASQYVITAQYTNGFEAPEASVSKAEIGKLKVLPVNSEALVDSKL